MEITVKSKRRKLKPLPPLSVSAYNLTQWFCKEALVSRTRTMLEFAEQEIVIPDDKAKRKFSAKTQPVVKFWFEAVDSGEYESYFLTGNTQSGKTLCGVVIPALYHLFEIGETVVVGLPTMDMAGDKWEQDFKPAIMASRYKDLIPSRGGGSRGGKIEEITFKNGATLKFMSGGGGDENRSGFTTRVVVLTEIDKFDSAGGTSRETDKISQIIARSDRWDINRRVYGECTVSIPEGRIWQEYTQGTQGHIVLKCPKCGEWTNPERKQFLGWEDAKTVMEAGKNARFHCVACGKAWTYNQRRKANHNAKVLFRTDKILVGKDGEEKHVLQIIAKNGKISGAMPQTDTFSFRWSAVNNLFWSEMGIGKRCWKAKRRENEEEAEKEITQFVWVRPYISDLSEVTPLTARAIQNRTTHLRRGIVPENTSCLVVTVDLGKYLAHWIAMAFHEPEDSCTQCHVVDYGQFEIPTDSFGTEKGTYIALNEFRDNIESGWICQDGKKLPPSAVWIDSGYPESQQAVYKFCRESGNKRYFPIKGDSMTQRQPYNQPKAKGKVVRKLGDNFFITRQRSERISLVIVNANHWKGIAQDRFTSPEDAPGALTLFLSADKNEHIKFSKHILAEKRVIEFKAGYGEVVKWQQIKGRANHWLDCLYLCCALGSYMGIKIIRSEAGVVDPKEGVQVDRSKKKGWAANAQRGA